jgi:hypothetical protein
VTMTDDECAETPTTLSACSAAAFHFQPLWILRDQWLSNALKK